MTESCERCRAHDGRETREYELKAKGQKRILCDPCAGLTGQFHEIKPVRQPFVAPEAQDESAPRRSRKQEE